MTQNELKERIRAGTLDGVFLFCGEEEYLKRYYLGEIRKAIVPDEEMAPFVHFLFDGAELECEKILDIARMPSMFATGKLIEWHNVDIDHMKEASLKELEALTEELQNEAGCTLILTATAEDFDTGSEKRPSKKMTRLGKCLFPVVFFRSSDAALVSWIKRHFAAEELSFTPTLPTALLARVGHDMDTLNHEIEKLASYAKANGLSLISEKEMEFVCIRTVESDAFSLTNAILDGKTEEAYLYLGDMKRRRVDPITVLAMVSKLYADLLSVALLTEEGKTEKEIAKELGMHEYKAGIYFRNAKKTGVSAIEAKLALCARIDASLKNGTSSYRGLEQLVATLGIK